MENTQTEEIVYASIGGIDNPIMIEYKDKYFELDNDTIIPAERLIEYEEKIKAKWALLKN